MNTLSRNCPVAFVVGAAGFLGSHLTDKLLEMGIQVVGLDDLSTGSKDYLEEATKCKKFHLLNQTATSKHDISFSRLDYAFFLLPQNLPTYEFQKALDNFLEVVLEYKPKVVLASSIELYDSESKGNTALKDAEEKLADFSLKNSLNARVVRLATVYGPRMHFEGIDPMVRLIEAAATGNLQKEIVALDFISRSLYIDDAVKLLIKAVMHGATAQKIYDGALVNPVKVGEIKQVLLDPLWYESRGFSPTELPPWSTPNLERTMKELSWNPTTPLVKGLKETIHFFKEHPPVMSNKTIEEERVKIQAEEKKGEEKVGESGGEKEVSSQGKAVIRISKAKVKKVQNISYKFFILALISAALIYPFSQLAWSIASLDKKLAEGAQAVLDGDLVYGKQVIGEADQKLGQIDKALVLGESLKGLGIGSDLLADFKNKQQISKEVNQSNKLALEGIDSLSKSWGVFIGEVEGSMSTLLEEALENLTQAEKKLAWVKAGQRNESKEQVNGLLDALNLQHSLARLFYEAVTLDGQKDYLVLLLDNTTLRPGGGTAVALAKISIKEGKLEKVKVEGVRELDESFKGHLEPPGEVKKDLQISSWLLKEAAVDLDLTSSNRYASWLYQKESGNTVGGVFSLDLTTLSQLLKILGPVEVGESKSKVDVANFQEKITTKEKDQLVTGVFEEILNRLFFLPQKDWSELLIMTKEAFLGKHLSFYFSDNSLLSFTDAQGWSGRVAKAEAEKRGEWEDFLAISEFSLSEAGDFSFIKRGVALTTNLSKGGEVGHKLSIDYLNQKPARGESTYKTRLKIYLPAGSKVTKALWGGENVFEKMTSFSDLGRAGYSFLLEIKPGQQKTLNLDYQQSKQVVFNQDQLKYKLIIAKQPGTVGEKFEVKLNHPEGYKIVNGFSDKTLTSYTGILSQDLNLEVTLDK